VGLLHKLRSMLNVFRRFRAKSQEVPSCLGASSAAPGRGSETAGSRFPATFWLSGAAPESNRPSVGLPRRTGFEDSGSRLSDAGAFRVQQQSARRSARRSRWELIPNAHAADVTRTE